MERSVDLRIVNLAIYTWAIASKQAHDNSKLLIENYSKNEAECIQRMEALHSSERVMLRLERQYFIDELPQPLARYIRASDNRGCDACWLASWRPKDHPECQAKIDEYFSARQALEEYGLKSDIQR